MLGLFLGITIPAACPAVHEFLHHDFLAPHHHCVVAQLTATGLLSGLGPIGPALPPALCLGVILDAGPLGVLSPDYRDAPCRAPPLA